MIGRAFRPPDAHSICLAKVRRRLGKRVEYPLQIEARTADHLEHIGGVRLLLQGFPQLGQQPGVLDRDYGLSGEVRNERDLLVGERPDFPAIYADAADELVLLEHRHSYYRSNAGEFNRRNPEWVAIEVSLIQTQVGDVHRSPR